MDRAGKAFVKRLEYRYLKPWLRKLKPWRRTNFGGIQISCQRHLDGGGSTFGQDYISFLRERGMPKQPRAFEWCAGPGFIGFSLLGNGLCDTLCLADINPEAVKACERTVRENRLAGRVAVYRSDNLSAIPPTEQWNLVVGNPPHFADTFDEYWWLRAYDDDWHIHRTFFAAVGKFLAPDGIVVLQENNRGSTAETFRTMIEQSGLAIAFVHGCAQQRTADDYFYFIGIVRRGDTPPAWAVTPSVKV
jgi:16S rRNA G966 N2-methylase RsmD